MKNLSTMMIGHYMHGISKPGGIATYIRRISQAQRQKGHKIVYLDSFFNGGTADHLSNNLVLVRDGQDLRIKAQKYQLDILHLHGAAPLDSLMKTPVIRTVHDNNPYCPSGSRFLKNWGQPCDRAYHPIGCLWGHFVDHCGSVRPTQLSAGFQRLSQEMKVLSTIPTITNSQFVKDQMLRSGYPDTHLYVLRYPAPDFGEFAPSPISKVPRFLFLSRITPEKGWKWLLKAVEKVGLPIHLDIAGTGSQQQNQAIREFAIRLSLQDKITFHGWVDENKASQLLYQARALIFPSVWHEPAGIVSLEAAAAGRPIIASKVGGIPEYTSLLQNTILVEPNDVGGLARSIEKLATDAALVVKMGLEGKKRVLEEFSIERHLEQLMYLYTQAIANNS